MEEKNPPKKAAETKTESKKLSIPTLSNGGMSRLDSVAWTAAAESEERDYHRMAAIGYAALFALVIAVVAFAYLTWWR